MSGAVLIAAAPASAAATYEPVNPVEMVFQANTGELWEASAGLATGNINTGLSVAAGTSPSVALDTSKASSTSFGGTPVVAFQGANGHLWIAGAYGTADLGLGMAPGTSPSIASNGPYSDGLITIAFQANTGDLVTTLLTPQLTTPYSVSTTYWDLPMAPTTSPAITPLPSNGYEVAYQNSTGALAVAGTDGTGSLGLGMKAGTNPSIAEVSGGYQIAFQANTGSLWTAGVLGTGNLGLGMDNTTSPSIALIGDAIGETPELTGTYEIAFQANTGDLWTVGNAGLYSGDLGQAVQPGTSPSIRGLAELTIATPGAPSMLSDAYSVAYQSTSGTLSFFDEHTGQVYNTGLGMANSTSPGSGGGYGLDANP